MSSALAPLHFRNQLHLLKEHFQTFKDSAERTWPGLKIRTLEVNGQAPEPLTLALYVQDNYFPAEISWMGHGLQMWLQMIWFLSRADTHETVILDEPDVYMHADLQRRLVQFVRKRHQQVIIATHSSEIMAEVLPEDILVVDRSKKRSDFASSLPAVQQVLSSFGSVHNLQLSRLWAARRFLIVEGQDIPLLKQFQNKLFPETLSPLDTIPSTSVGGWGGWNLAIGSEVLLKNAGGDGIITYAIFDSDYHSDEIIKNRYLEAKKRGISLHVWLRKEVENYVLHPGAIQRAVQSLLSAAKIGPTLGEIERKLEAVAEDMKQETIDCIATHIHNSDRKLSVATANQRARKVVSARWQTPEARFGIIGGKEALSRISTWVQDTYKVSIGSLLIAFHMAPDEISAEVRMLLTTIEECEPFPDQRR